MAKQLSKGEQTRIKLLEVGKELLYTKDVASVSVASIAKGAGFAKGTFYIYFESKEDFVWALIEYDLGKANQIVLDLQNVSHNEAGIMCFSSKLLEEMFKKIEALKLMHHIKFHGYLGQDRIEKKYTTLWYKVFYSWIDDGCKKGSFSVPNMELYTLFILKGLHEVLEQMILNPQDMSIEDCKKTVASILIRLLVYKE